jgi:hypothetical protein
MWIYIVLTLIVILIAVLMFIYIVHYNKFQIAIIKISEAEENISMLLNKKLELLIRINKFIEEKKAESKLVGIEKIGSKNLNNFELNTELEKFNKKIIEITDYSKEIIFDEHELEVVDELDKINIECLAAEKYYNDNVVLYNNLVKCFPSNIISHFCNYKMKDFYSNEKEEIFEILKK